MKSHVADLFTQALESLTQEGTLPESSRQVPVKVDNTRDPSHGDLATNIAMVLAKQAGMPPRALAEKIVAALPADPAVRKVEIAGPGFINLFLDPAAHFSVIRAIFEAGAQFGRATPNSRERVQVEFVSANPTGPLHVGHGRGAAYGATISNLLEAAGYQVHREYYVNDAGRQMNILATSVWLRYLEALGETFPFPSNGYKGDYIRDIAETLHKEVGDRLHHPADTVFEGVPADEPAGGDKEAHIDGLINRARTLLGADYEHVFNLALNSIVEDIRNDLEEFGVTYQEWFSEKSVQPQVERAIQILQDKGYIYEKDGALWFRSTDFGDDKDRVVRRENGETTYFASDIAYHLNKFERGFDRVINVWGADHHGYICRVKAALQAMGLDPERLVVKLVQFAILYRGGERVQMSTRSGSFVTLRELREEVGNDAARFFYVTRKADQHLDFDLDLAKSQSKDNPVYYIQYAHARVCSVHRKLTEQNLSWTPEDGLAALDALTLPEEKAIAQMLARYPEVVANAAEQLEPHQVTHYLRDLASEFHAWYNNNRVLEDDARLRNARLALAEAVRSVIHNGLSLLGVSAPESM
ncbi:arginine--tRNA ligase [Hahella sp. SMD15-11]|uniref:Arginine--tRNA ligase n=1 Tax=Thermohahella caldifontis TaxID=3142973 RepID=A0AB39US54_9GAMM